MSTLTLDTVRREAERLTESVSRALWLAHAGLAPLAPLEPLYARHAAAYGDDALALAREAAAAGDATVGLLAEWIAETRVARELSPLDERELAWERAAVVRLPDARGGAVRAVEYARVPIALANAGDAADRAALEKARAALVQAELAPLRRERVEREHAAVEALGVADGYVATFEALSGIDLAALDAQCAALLADTQAMWDDVLPAYARRRLGMEVGAMSRGDVAALFRAPEYDRGFPPGGMVATVRTQLAAMGLDPTADGRVRYDVGEREGKRARAFCAPVRVPDEVHLVLRPSGGAGDWKTLLHEVGHALHFAHVRRDLPFEARWAGDHSVTEGFAMLFDHLLLDRGWLRRYTELDAARVDEFLRAQAFHELYFLRRYAAKLRYERVLHGGREPLDALPELYVETMSRATGVRHASADAFVDVDPRLYVVRYLRAWQLQALLAGALRETFDEDWWRNPRTGPFAVAQLFAPGQREGAEALAARVVGDSPAEASGRTSPLGFAPLVTALERLLA